MPKFHINPKKWRNPQNTLTLGILLLGSDGKIDADAILDDGNLVKFKLIKTGPMIFTVFILIFASIIAFLLINGYISFTG